MGCALSAFDKEDATTNRHSNRLRRYKIVRPVGDNNLPTKKLLDGSEDSLDSQAKKDRKSDIVVVMNPLSEQEMKGKQDEKIKEEKVQEKQKAQKVVNSGGKGIVGVKGDIEDHQNIEETEEAETGDREDHISKVPGSPSFRDFCVDLNPKLPRPKKKIVIRDPSFSEYFNDDSSESTKNEEDDDSSTKTNKQQKEEGSNSNKEAEKKERRGRGSGMLSIKEDQKGRKIS